MNNFKIISMTIACSFLFGTAQAELKAEWVEGYQYNKNIELLTKKLNSPEINLSKDTVSYSYQLERSEPLDFNQKPFIETSKQYWLDTDGFKLANGLNLAVTGGEAIIRISPLTNDKSIKLTAEQIQISNNGQLSQINVFADSQQLKATGAAFSDHSIALKLQANAGHLNLKVNNSNPDTPFVIHVLEPNSTYELSLTSVKATYASNQSIQINSRFMNNKSNIKSELQGYINRPDGSILGELQFSKLVDGSYSASIDIDTVQGLAQGLWEAHVFAKSDDNGLEIMRDAQTSFAVNLNSAHFDGQVNWLNNKIQMGLKVGLSGRYEVRGVLFGTDQSGNLKPLAMTMTAKWLDSGNQSIELDIDNKSIKDSGLKAPFEIRNLQLTNQTYMAPVQKIISGIKLLETAIDRR